MSSAIHNDTAHAQATQTSTESQRKGQKSDEGNRAADKFSKMLDGFRAHGLVEIDGGDGNDTINTKGVHVRVNGGAGDDVINVEITPQYHAPHHITRHDIEHMRQMQQHLSHHVAHHEHLSQAQHMRPGMIGVGAGHVVDLTPASEVQGGAGNDTIKTNGITLAHGGSGDDTIDIMSGTAFGGTGNDTISNKSSANVYGGAGDDVIRSSGFMNINSNLFGGAGNDEIFASGSQLSIDGGSGDDEITLDGEHQKEIMRLNLAMDHHGHHMHLGNGIESGQSTVNGGLGDDNITITNEATAVIEYFAGDGHDTLQGANETNILKFGSGLTIEDATFSNADGNLTISFSDTDGSVTIQNFQDQGVPMIQFSDGRTLDASTTITKAGADANGYRADDDRPIGTKSELKVGTKDGEDHSD